MSSPSEIKSIYFAALAKKSATERAEYLDRACGADVELRERIERLLAANPLAEDVPYRTPADRPELDPTGAGLNLTTIARAIAPAGDDVTYGFEPVRPGQVLETLARSIGPIPRVLLPETSPDDVGAAVIKPPSEELPAPAQRGDRYQLFGEIARGGMGVVFKGRAPDLGRDLAVKIPQQ